MCKGLGGSGKSAVVIKGLSRYPVSGGGEGPRTLESIQGEQMFLRANGIDYSVAFGIWGFIPILYYGDNDKPSSCNQG